MTNPQPCVTLPDSSIFIKKGAELEVLPTLSELADPLTKRPAMVTY